MIISIASTMKKVARNIVLFILLLSGFTFYNFFNGIEIEKLDLKILTIEKLYMKWDKKLIVTAKKLEINEEGKSKNSLEQLDKILTNFKLLLTFFEKIYIENLYLKEQNVSILYENELFYIDSKYLNLATLFEFDEKKSLIGLDIKSLFLKDYNLLTDGNATLNLKKSELKYSGEYSIEKISGEIFISGNEKDIDFKLVSNRVKSIDGIRKYIKIDEHINEWIFDRVKAKNYTLDYITFKLDRDFKFKYPSLKAIATLENVQVKFNKKLPEVEAKSVKVKFINNRLTFNLDKPKYLGIDLSGSFVDIESLSKGSTLNVIIKMDSSFNQKIIDILKAYKINIPIKIYASKVDSVVKINLKLLSELVNVDGYFQIKNANMNINDIRFFTKNAKLILENNNLYIKGFKFNYDNIIDASANLNIDFHSRNIVGEALFNKFEIKENGLIKLQNFYTPLKFSFRDNLLLEFTNLNAKLLNTKNYSVIYLNDISKLYFYSNLLKKYNIKSGSLKIKTKDFKNYNIFANLRELETPLFKYGKFIGDKKVFIKVENDIKISSINRDLTANIDKNKNITATLNGYDIFLPDIKKLKDNNNSKKELNLKLKTKNTNLYFGDRLILSEEFDLNMQKERIAFNSKYQNSVIKFEKVKGKFFLKANNLDEIFLQSFLQKDKVEGGLYNMEVKGDEEMFKGKITFQNVTIKNLKALNNLISFLDTLPALVTFQSPGFSEHGYEVKKGSIEFAYFKDLIYVRNFELKGKSIDILGDGVIYLDKEEVDFRIKLSSVKNLSKIIKNIPLVGYLVLGDGRITTNLSVTGDMFDPKVTTNMIEDTLKAPLNIIQRTLTLPLKFLELFKEKKDE